MSNALNEGIKAYVHQQLNIFKKNVVQAVQGPESTDAKLNKMIAAAGDVKTNINRGVDAVVETVVSRKPRPDAPAEKIEEYDAFLEVATSSFQSLHKWIAELLEKIQSAMFEFIGMIRQAASTVTAAVRAAINNIKEWWNRLL